MDRKRESFSNELTLTETTLRKISKLPPYGNEMKANYIQLMILLASGKHDDHLEWNISKIYEKQDKEIRGFAEYVQQDEKASWET